MVRHAHRILVKVDLVRLGLSFWKVIVGGLGAVRDMNMTIGRFGNDNTLKTPIDCATNGQHMTLVGVF